MYHAFNGLIQGHAQLKIHISISNRVMSLPLLGNGKIEILYLKLDGAVYIDKNVLKRYK